MMRRGVRGREREWQGEGERN